MKEKLLCKITYFDPNTEKLKDIYGCVRKSERFSNLNDFIIIENETPTILCKFNIETIEIYKILTIIAFARQEKTLYKQIIPQKVRV